MWDDDRDNDMMRRQILAIVLSMVVLWGYFTFFMPEPPRPPVPVQDGQSETRTLEPADPSRERAELRGGDGAGDEESSTDGWPGLPPVPDSSGPDDEIVIRDADLELTFTRIGGRLKEAVVIIGTTGEGNIQLVPQPPEGVPPTMAEYPLGLRFTDERLGDRLDYRRFDAAVDDDGRGVTFTLELPNTARVTKRFRLSDRRHVLDIDVGYRNLESASRTLGIDVEPAYIVNWAPNLVVVDEGTYFPPEFVWFRDGETDTLQADDLPEEDGVPEDRRFPNIEWLGYKSKYFLTALKPGGEDAITDGWARGTAEKFRFGVYRPKFEVGPGETDAGEFELYVGPMQLESLEAAWPTLPRALRFFGPGGWFGDTVSDVMDWFAKLLLSNLTWWHSFIPNWGVSIVLMTLLVRVIMFPLMLKQIRSMKQMQALQPEMMELREKYKDDPQKMNQAMMEFYRERKINPLAGCFPIFLQMPVFIALYRMLWKAFELRGADFLWVDDLSLPDRLFHMPFMGAIPFLGEYLEYFNLLPVLVGATMLLSFRLQPTSGPMQNPQQKFIMNFMPVMFTVISYTFSAGLNLYVLVSTALGILQNYLVRTTDIAGPAVEHSPAAETTRDADAGQRDGDAKPKTKSKPKSKGKTPSAAGKRKKPQHFYDRAQKQKREMARAQRKRKKK